MVTMNDRCLLAREPPCDNREAPIVRLANTFKGEYYEHEHTKTART
jgi:hypothetical protein